MSSKRLLSTKLRGVDLLLCESWDPLKVWDKGSDLKVQAGLNEGKVSEVRETKEETAFV